MPNLDSHPYRRREMKEFDKLSDEMLAAGIDADKFSLGNKAAGTRLRAHMQTIKALAQDVRTAVIGSK